MPIRPLLWFSADQTHPPQTHFSSNNQTHTDTILLIEAQPSSVIDDFYFVWSKLRKKIGDFGWWFFFFFFLLLWTSGGGGGWCCGCFFGNGIYYFIVVNILFYYDVYIILLC